MKIEISQEQYDLLLSQNSRLAEQYKRDAANLMRLAPEYDEQAVKDTAFEWLQTAEDLDELVSSLLAQAEGSDDHA